MHELLGALPDHFDLEPWEDSPCVGEARYWRTAQGPQIDESGRQVWTHEYRPRLIGLQCGFPLNA